MAVAHFTAKSVLPLPGTCEDIMNINLRTVLATSVAALVMVGGVGARSPRAAAQPRLAVQERLFPIPMSLVQEHAELNTALNAAANLPDETGAAARRVLALITPHIKDEQRRVFPLLNLLPPLGKQEIEPWMADLLPVADRLRDDIETIRRAHAPIRNALDELNIVAWREGHEEYAFLAQRIRQHIQMEEEILYPAALVVGDYLRLKFPSPATASAP
jgi:hypothetical protein